MPGFTLRSSCNAPHPPGPTHYASRLIRLFIVFLLAASLPACMPAQASNTGSPTALLATPSLGVSPSSTPENPSRPTFTTTASPVIQATPEVTQTLLPVLLATATSPVTVRFAALGDYGQASQPEQDVANLIKSWEPNFIITLGDNNYPSGSAATIDANIGQYYYEFISSYTGSYGEGASANRFFPSLGNHDWQTSSAQPYLDYFSLPANERYYEFRLGPAHLFAIDSDEHEPDGFRHDSPQATWLMERLSASDAPWKIVYFHHAPYSSGPHGGTIWMQWPFQAWGVTAVLSGHDHTYERLLVGGMPYFVNGLGGSTRYNFGVPVAGSQVRYNADYGAMLIDATSDQITFQFINRLGQVVDTYSISTARSE